MFGTPPLPPQPFWDYKNKKIMIHVKNLLYLKSHTFLLTLS